MAWIARQSCWFLWPDFTNVFVGAESSESFEALGKVIGHQEGVEMLFQVLVHLVMIFFDRTPSHPGTKHIASVSTSRSRCAAASPTNFASSPQRVFACSVCIPCASP